MRLQSSINKHFAVNVEFLSNCSKSSSADMECREAQGYPQDGQESDADGRLSGLPTT
jgi:hypothetical protein